MSAECCSLQLAADDTMDANSSCCDEISDYGSGHDIITDENNIDVKMEADGKCLLYIRYQNRSELLEGLEQLYANAKKKEVFHSRRRKHPLTELNNESPNGIGSKQFKRAYGRYLCTINYILV